MTPDLTVVDVLVAVLAISSGAVITMFAAYCLFKRRAET